MSVATVNDEISRRDAPPADAYELNRRRVYIFPTRYGFSFYTVLIVMLLGSINYNNSLGFLLTFLLGSLSLVAIVHTYRNLAGLELRLRASRSVFAGQECRFMLHFDNREGSQRIGVIITYSIDPQAERPQPVLTHTSLPADALHAVELKVRATHRGRLNLGRIVLASRFPLGLFRAWAHFEPATTALVFPRLEGVRELPLHLSESASPGGTQSQGTDDFTGLRNYVPGDSSRRIHWKAVAREQETTVKQFAGTAPSEVKLRWTSAPQPGLEARLSQLALWVVQANTQGLAFSMELPTKSFPTAEGEQHRQLCLRALALYAIADNATDTG